MSDIDRQSLMEVFTFEMSHMLEQLEQIVIEAEHGYGKEQIDEIFRIMHTIKGSAAMMMFDNIAAAGHAIEDLFYYLRERKPEKIDASKLTDYVLEGMDFLKYEMSKLQEGLESDGDPSAVSAKISDFLIEIKVENDDAPAPPAANKAAIEAEKAKAAEEISAIARIEADGNKTALADQGFSVFKAVVTFQDGSEMENVRAYTLMYNLKNLVHEVYYWPEDLINENTISVIREKGFLLEIITDKSFDEIKEILDGTVYAKDISLEDITEQKAAAPAAVAPEAPLAQETVQEPGEPKEANTSSPAPVLQEQYEEEVITMQTTPVVPENAVNSVGDTQTAKKAPTQSMISVNVSKLDELLKLVGELVIAEAMVTQNTSLEQAETLGVSLDDFKKDSRHLSKIISDLQTTVMSTRMLTLQNTFNRMNRIVRDMCKQLGKDVNLEILGENTEVDKNIIEHISDPIMHIVRNAVDHGIEAPGARKAAGKPERGTVTLEAKTVGSDVVISISDDGGGINKDKVLAKAQRNGLLRKAPADYSDKEIFQFIFMPGFSTSDNVTNFSGRGVGMDVVNKNMEVVQGTTSIDSVLGEGSVITMRIPLTLAIIKSMTIKVGGEKYTVPIDAISNSFKPKRKDMFVDPNGNEMITVYGRHMNVVKLFEFFELPEAARDVEDGLMMIMTNGDDEICLFIDELITEQSVVQKPLPKYIKKIPGISACTLLGNGDISLILEPAAFFDR